MLVVVFVQEPSHVQFFVTPWTATRQASLSLTISQSLPKFILHWIGDAVQPSHPLMPSLLPALDLSQHRELFQWVICSHQMTKILEFQLSISPSSEYSALISLKIDWFDLSVQGIFRSLLQHHSLKAWIRWRSAFFMVQLSQSRIESKKLLAIIRHLKMIEESIQQDHINFLIVSTYRLALCSANIYFLTVPNHLHRETHFCIPLKMR